MVLGDGDGERGAGLPGLQGHRGRDNAHVGRLSVAWSAAVGGDNVKGQTARRRRLVQVDGQHRRLALADGGVDHGKGKGVRPGRDALGLGLHAVPGDGLHPDLHLVVDRGGQPGNVQPPRWYPVHFLSVVAGRPCQPVVRGFLPPAHPVLAIRHAQAVVGGHPPRHRQG